MTPDDEIEATARALLRETIERAGWYPSLRRSEREKRIAQDLHLHWHLMVPELRKRLEQGIRQGRCG
ncbi:hypothetical protein ILT44_29980 [Microvirga sp. BT689]|uniref:hypothetical protein n=1 Tax=Microvirga arvi TaxID=2778731 RepID=UPI001950D26A|nr:hypothetical protein [Microvirga arvi]MBM6584421.1 hypothetical protein [Microvirga arvi]